MIIARDTLTGLKAEALGRVVAQLSWFSPESDWMQREREGSSSVKQK